jgi:hypothetical protein
MYIGGECKYVYGNFQDLCLPAQKLQDELAALEYRYTIEKQQLFHRHLNAFPEKISEPMADMAINLHEKYKKEKQAIIDRHYACIVAERYLHRKLSCIYSLHIGYRLDMTHYGWT